MAVVADGRALASRMAPAYAGGGHGSDVGVTSWRSLLAWLGLALLTRLPGLLAVELNWDEQLYALVARSWLAGGLPYEALWDRKPVGLFVAVAGAIGLAGDTLVALRGLTVLGLGAGAWCLARIAREWGMGRAGAAVAGMGWLLYAGRADAGGFNAEHLFVPLNLGAMLLMLAASGPIAWGMAGLLMGAALQVKYAALFGSAAAILVSVVWRGRPRAAEVVALVAGTAAPTLAAVGWYALAGRFDLWWEANIIANLPVLAAMVPGAPADEAGVSVGYMASRYAVPLLGLGGAVLAWARGERRVAAGLLIWIEADIVGLWALRRLADHMMIQALPGFCVGLAAIVDAIARGRWRVAWAVALLSVWLARDGIGFAREAQAAAEIVARRRAGEAGWGDPVATAGVRLRVAMREGEGLYVFGGPVLGLYGLTGRAPPTRFPFAMHLWESYAPAAARGELARILERRPDWIAVVPGWADGAAAGAPLREALSRHYAPAGQVRPFASAGGGAIGPRVSIDLYRRRD